MRTRDPVDNIGDRQISADQLQIVLNGAFAECALEEASNEVHHHGIVLLLQNVCKLGEYGHPIVANAQLRNFGDGSALLLDMLPELRDQREDWIIQYVTGDVIVSLLLIPDVN